MIRLDVPGRPGETYPVHIGPLDRAPLPRRERPLPCITDEHVWALHGERVAKLMPLDPRFVPRGEAAKNWSQLERAISMLADRGHARAEPVVALGGGAIGDLAGLAAALYKRGTPVIQLPTSLLAMVDSSVGGKTAIDAEGQKNLVGAFHPPAAVFADPAFLETLDRRELGAGLAETLKYGVIGDSDFYERLVAQDAARLLEGDPEAASRTIATAVTAKAGYVADDLEDRTGRRALLNFGHSFGHAIESATGLDRLLHGEAVAVGMVLAARFSETLGHCPAAAPRRLQRDLAALGLPTRLRDIDLEGQGARLFEPMRRDKKNPEGRFALILLRDIGHAFLDRDVDPDRLRAFLALA